MAQVVEHLRSKHECPEFTPHYHDLPPTKKKKKAWFTPGILATLEAEIRRISVQGQLRQIVCETLSHKITSVKWTGGMTQAVEHLLCKCEALSSNPSPTKNKQTKR
jgi:hypothetical protein